MNAKPEEQTVLNFWYIPEEGNAEFYRMTEWQKRRDNRHGDGREGLCSGEKHKHNPEKFSVGWFVNWPENQGRLPDWFGFLTEGHRQNVEAEGLGWWEAQEVIIVFQGNSLKGSRIPTMCWRLCCEVCGQKLKDSVSVPGGASTSSL